MAEEDREKKDEEATWLVGDVMGTYRIEGTDTGYEIVTIVREEVAERLGYTIEEAQEIVTRAALARLFKEVPELRGVNFNMGDENIRVVDDRTKKWLN